MGIHRGPNPVNDGLVFGYDTGYGVADNNTATRFYPGENTVNYTTDTASQGGWGGSYNVVDSSRKKFRLNVSGFNGNPGAGWRAFTWDLRAYTGQSVTISATVEVPASSPGTFAWIMMGQTNTHTSNGTGAGMYMGYSASGERVQKTTTTKERITWSGTLGNSGTASQPSGHVGFTVWYNNGVPGTNSYVEVSDVQIELKSHETPFVNGTRSSTASLIDLKRTTSIDVSNVSFDSTGQPTFDGSDDRIYLGQNLGFNNASFSVEAMVKWDGVGTDTFFGYGDGSGTRRNIHWRIYTTGQLRFDFYSDSINSAAGKIIADEWVHLLTTYDVATDTCTCYKNGEILMSGSSGPYEGIDSASSGYAGAWDATTQNFGGELPVLKVYNRTLTAAEIKQNYNAYKNRFDI